MIGILFNSSGEVVALNNGTKNENLNADMVDGQHFNWNNNKNDHTYLWAASSSGQAYLVHRASISVNYANSAGSVARVTFGDAYNGTHDANSITSNGLWYYSSNGPATSLGATTSDGALYSQAYSTSWVGQIAQDYRNGRLFVRGKNNGSWTSWLRVALYSEIPATVSVDYTIWRDSSSNVDYKLQVVSSLPSSTNSNTFYVIV